MTDICIRIHFEVLDGTKQAASADEAYKVAEQVNADALFGTFFEFDWKEWDARMARRPEELSTFTFNEQPIDADRGRYEFTLALNSELFPPEMGGLSHLIGVMTGDLFNFVLPPLTVKNFEVREIVAPDQWISKHKEAFRSKANDIASVREQLKVEPELPLLAFSFKPRVGFHLQALRDIAIAVLDEGFSIVELDTRFLPLDRKHLEELKNLALEVSEKTKNKNGRLSLNFSLPSDILLEELESYLAMMPPPVVIKIDGGIGGFDAIQAVRRRGLCDSAGSPPIVTCYPLLRSAFGKLVPPDNILEGLMYSGADIIYPGRRPDLGTMRRSLDGTTNASVIKAINRYRRFSNEGTFMPTIAGGIYAGQLHAYYELLGPNVAWFLGGGVALHKDGPREGAKLCMEVARAAAENRAKSGSSWSGNLKGGLAKRCDAAYEGRSSLNKEELVYVSPEELHKLDQIGPWGS